MSDAAQQVTRCERCGRLATEPCICPGQTELFNFLQQFRSLPSDPAGSGPPRPDPSPPPEATQDRPAHLDQPAEHPSPPIGPAVLVGQTEGACPQEGSAARPSGTGSACRRFVRVVAVIVVAATAVIGVLLETGSSLTQGLLGHGGISLPPLLESAPGPGYLPEVGGVMNGYVTSSRLQTVLGGTTFPEGLRTYARTWVRQDLRSSVVEAVTLALNRNDAVRTVAHLYSVCTARGGTAVQIPGLAGADAGGCDLSALVPPETEPGFYVVVARSRLALLFMVSAPGSPGAQALGIHLAQSTAARFAADPGEPQSGPLPDSLEIYTGGLGGTQFDQELGGLLIAAVVLVGLRFALNRWVLQGRLDG